jgi:hypothetical protein
MDELKEKEKETVALALASGCVVHIAFSGFVTFFQFALLGHFSKSPCFPSERKSNSLILYRKRFKKYI